MMAAPSTETSSSPTDAPDGDIPLSVCNPIQSGNLNMTDRSCSMKVNLSTSMREKSSQDMEDCVEDDGLYIRWSVSTLCVGLFPLPVFGLFPLPVVGLFTLPMVCFRPLWLVCFHPLCLVCFISYRFRSKLHHLCFLDIH